MDQIANPKLQASMDDFINHLIEEKKFENLDDDIRTQLRKDLQGRLSDTIVAKSIGAMSDTDVEAFDKLLDTNPTPEQIQEFIATKIPDSTNFLARVLVNFRNLYLGQA